ncbi:MAG: glycosyl transferase family 1 [Flavobacteriia bacterium]|nr:glycosyl transferase family 1 [Flavobacteriia bacterium]
MKNETSAVLITFYWPPAGGAGVHRWLRFSNYFKENGVNLHVYCPENAEWPLIDKELESLISSEIKIIKRKIFEPHKYIGKKNNPNVSGGFTRSNKSSIVQKLVIWTRGNLFIPDARMFWIRPSISFLKKYIKAHPEIKTIISTGPPHSLHLIARKLKKQFPNVKWIADFRDPWTEIDFYKELNLGKWADKQQHRLEKACLQEADEVVTISQNCAIGLETIAGRKIEVITNGYNFPEFDQDSIQLDQKFSIVHFGSMPFARNPEVIWQALHILCNENDQFRKDLEIKLVGPVDYTVQERIEQNKLTSYFKHIPLVKHQESIQMQRETQVLLLVGNNTGNVKGILTGKFFEYLGAYRPILAVGAKNSDLEEMISFTKSGFFVDYNNLNEAKNAILHFYELFQKKQLHVHSENLSYFTSQELAKKFCELIKR